MTVGEAIIEQRDELSIEAAAVLPSGRMIHSDVWRLAWPSVITMALQTVNSLMDAFFVGHLPNGRQALAATGAAGFVIFLLVSVAMGITVGTTALVARFTGADEPRNAVRATGQSLTLGALIGLVLGVAGMAARGVMAGAMLNGGENAEAVRLCVQFLGIAVLMTPALFVMNVFHAAFRGVGDTRTPLLVTLAAIATHITGNYLLVNGRYGLPRLGVAGAATAYSLSILVGLLLFVLLLPARPVLAGALTRHNLRLEREWAIRILRIGMPAAFQAVIRTLSMMSFTGMLAHTIEKDAAVAALQIGIRGESLAFMPGFGYSVAASALVGQSLGARDPHRAERYGWAATAQAILVMSIMATLFFTFARPFAALFTDDPLVQRLGAEYLRINAVCEPFLAIGMVLTGALQGAGDTIRPSYITIFTMWIFRMPLAFLLMFTLNMQTRGAWISMVFSTIIGGLMTLALFRGGRWKRIKV